jgi:hypothetical protein
MKHRAPYRRRQATAALIGALVLFGAIFAVARAVDGPSRVKVVRVVTVTRRTPTAPSHAARRKRRVHRPARHHFGGPPGLAPASAGTNGSFSPSSRAAVGGPSVLPPEATRSFAALRSQLPGPVDLAVAPVEADRVQVLGDDLAAAGWSTTKVPVLTALLAARGAGGLTPTERQEANLAITESDNQSILDLFGDLEQLKGGLIGASDAVQQLLRESGDDRTIVATAPPPPGGVTTFGQTQWSPGEAVKFYQALARGCLLSSSPTQYVLGLMQQIIPSESWGLGSAGFAVPVAFKGGWGPEPSGYLVRQSGVIDVGSTSAVAVAIVAYPPAGASSFETGTQMLTETAQWLRREIVLQPQPGATCTG